ncbi:MAG: GFA family protein [Kiloniellales bacterium]|nr:GFA family protein [Kiloniellales bacterium]
MKLKGGCLCGAVRFETDTQPQWIRHCHCVQCRKQTGAAFVTGLMYRAEDLRWTGETRSYESSAGVSRTFCPTCGGSLAFRQADAPEKDCLMLGAFDDPSLIEIDGNVEHVFAERELDWLHLDDDFPRVDGQPMGLYKIK